MATPYSDCARMVGRLHKAVVELENTCGLLQLDPVEGREWYELLTRKLIPQLSDDAYLVAAVVGGTNIGKSVVFNHIAGCRTSSTSPLASGTKHPVCLVPPEFGERDNLESVFQGFEVEEWTTAEAPLNEHETDKLYWQSSDEIPRNLLVLDTPDIDSDARVNWRRADNIRRCADVLIAVLTQQKYNDAAVKQFFRKAADEDKAVIVIFNQCQLPSDEEYWPIWLSTFCNETRITPEFVYLAPSDREAAEQNRLTFFSRDWKPEEADDGPTAITETHDAHALSEEARNLTEDLSRLHFGEIKVRALRGSLTHLLDVEQGVPSFLAETKNRAGEFRSAAELLSTHNLAEIDNWPPIANRLLVSEIRQWWQTQRVGWSAKVHGFYNSIGNGLSWPFKYAHEKIRGPQTHPLDLYRQQEWNVILDAVEKVYQKLDWFHDLGNELLQPRLEKLLGGRSRSELLQIMEEEHQKVDIQNELEQLVLSEMQTFRSESPQFYSFLQQLDVAAAAARPVVSVALIFSGVMAPVGNAAASLAVDSVTQTAVHVAGDVATGTAAAAVGDTALSGTASSSLGFVQAKFQQLHATFAARRAGWLSRMLKDNLLGSLPDELQEAAGLADSTVFKEVQAAVEELSERMEIELQESIT